MSSTAFSVYQTLERSAIDLFDVFGGLFKGLVYGAIVAISGCLRGIECGRSSAAVGAATTSAVVTSIVFIVIACAMLTVAYDIMGIISTSARMRGTTRKSMGEMPMVLSASISSLTVMVPSSAA